ncbi:MAG: hypothetical protein K8I27_17165 [Planctomycetes bacterium]|nr:hypothetical protein [Planctomycetota bacterium]
MRFRFAALFCLLPVVTAVSAQLAEKPPFEFKVSGDTVDTFKMELVKHYVPDQSLPSAAVLTYSAYTDNRESAAGMMKTVGEKWEAAVMKSLDDYESRLLTVDAVKALDGSRQKPEPPTIIRTYQPTEVAATKQQDDSTMVETLQVMLEKRKEFGSNKWIEGKREVKRRFYCVPGDGKWRINKIEQEVKDEENKGAKTWQEDSGMLVFMLYASELKKQRKEIPAIKQGTPREAATSLFDSLLPRRDAMDEGVHSTGLDAWIGVLQPLFTESHVNRQKQMVEEWLKQQPVPVEREIDTITEADGITTVKFKPVDEWSGAIELQVEKVGEVYKIHAAGVYEQGLDGKGGIAWKLKPEPDLYALKWR